MKRIYTIVIVMFAVCGMTAFADTVIPVDQLPAVSADFIKQYFPGTVIAFVKADSDEYDVLLADKTKIQFKRSGEWEEIRSATGIPAAVLPAPVAERVYIQYPDRFIVQVEKDSGGYEVELSNRAELKISEEGKLLRLRFAL